MWLCKFIGEKAYQARARSRRGHLYCWSSNPCLQCASYWPSDKVCASVCSENWTGDYISWGWDDIYQLTNFYLCRKPCKVGTKYLEDGSKVRVSRGIGASGSIIPRPEILKIRTTPRPTVRKYLKCLCLFLVWVVLLINMARTKRGLSKSEKLKLYLDWNEKGVCKKPIFWLM